MNFTTIIPTDLITPLGAYIRLRCAGVGAFLLESVEHGRLGRYSFVGHGSRLVSFDEAEVCGQPVVGFDYERGVRRIKEHIRGGDALQVVLSQRAERPTGASAIDLYRTLRRVNPSPYLFLLELDGLALIGSSPETLVKAEGRRASTNPHPGTTAPGPRDAQRLLASPKDRAEHVMLVDLGRNDLSRVCVPGTVQLG